MLSVSIERPIGVATFILIICGTSGIKVLLLPITYLLQKDNIFITF